MPVTELRVTIRSNGTAGEVAQDLANRCPNSEVQLLTWCADEKLYVEMVKKRERDRQRLVQALKDAEQIVRWP